MTSRDLKVIDAQLEKGSRGDAEAFLRRNPIELGHDAPTSLLQLCDFCESIIAMPIDDDRDRRIILDAAYTLTLCFLVMGAISKSRALCRLLIHGNRALPGRPQELQKTLALMDRLLKTNSSSKSSAKQAADSRDGLATPPPEYDEAVVNTRAALNPLPMENKIYPSYSLKSMNAEESKIGMKSYGVQRTQANDPSITRALFGGLKRIAPATQDTTNSINYIADFKNPSHPLSPHYTPFVTVPVPMRVFEDETPTPFDNRYRTAAQAPASKPKLLQKAKSAVISLGYPAKSEPYRFVRMSRDEYMRCWARDSNGNYLGTEPEGSGDAKMKRDWLANGAKAISQLEYVGHITEGREPFRK